MTAFTRAVGLGFGAASAEGSGKTFAVLDTAFFAAFLAGASAVGAGASASMTFLAAFFAAFLATLGFTSEGSGSAALAATFFAAFFAAFLATRFGAASDFSEDVSLGGNGSRASSLKFWVIR
jgi:hypothetical protein